MIRYTIIVVVIFLIIACKQNNTASVTGSNYNIENNRIKPSIDTLIFKSKEKDSTTKLTFKILNTSTLPIQIIKASASCECTSIQFDSSEIKRGDSTNIRLVYKHKGLEFSGLKNVVLETNAQQRFIVVYLKEVSKM